MLTLNFGAGVVEQHASRESARVREADTTK